MPIRRLVPCQQTQRGEGGGIWRQGERKAKAMDVKLAKAMSRHQDDMAAMHWETLWPHFLVIALGAWLLTSPFQFALFDTAAASTVQDVTQERGLWEPALRNALTGWNDLPAACC